MANEIRNRFTDTEMQIAKETDLPELLTHLGYQVRRIGRYHTTVEMDLSLIHIYARGHGVNASLAAVAY